MNSKMEAMVADFKTITQNVLHAEERGNPFPEKFVTGELNSFFIPDGTFKTPDSEKEVCKLINELRKKSYPVEVNTLWGWELVTEKNKKEGEVAGELRVPDPAEIDLEALGKENSLEYEESLYALEGRKTDRRSSRKLSIGISNRRLIRS
ncbi:MAG: hypothetical protein ACJAZX_000100 [Rickettsiales bacterium]|jgi:hypothetical protein